jgi:phosphomevalonate kinase
MTRAAATDGPGTRRRFLAPGKLMIAGEYAVLGPGGAALAVAVSGGVEADVMPSEAWELARVEGPTWRRGEVPEELRFAHAAWSQARGALVPHRVLTRACGAASSGVRKPGVGGSASAAVAVTAALHGLAGRDLRASATRAAVLGDALAAHRAAQHGRGSGYDVATATVGGLVLWRPASGEAAVVDWPDGLQIVAGYSGRSAPTSAQLASVEARAGRALGEDLRRLAAPVDELIDAARGRNLGRVLAGVRRCQRALAAWDSLRQLGIVTAEVAALIALAERCGAAAKVSGAGGGDSVIALADDETLIAAVQRAWRRAGFEPLDVELDHEGVRELTAHG